MAIYRDDWRLTACFQGIGAMVLVGGCAIASENPALAQVTPDATLGAEGRWAGDSCCPSAHRYTAESLANLPVLSRPSA